MKCRYPIILSGRTPFGCGQCIPCRVKKRREWTHRISLEALQHPENAFLTLTYSDDCLPSDYSLNPKHFSGFMKRLRKRVSPRLVRYVGVGEYGDQTERPHYHAIIFNHPTCLRGVSQVSRRTGRCCSVCDLYTSAWAQGHVHCGQVSLDSISYVCGYVVKKMTRSDDSRLNGRHPEFARMSNRPGIGASAMDDLSSLLLGLDLEDTIEDVPYTLRHGRREYPLGRYLRRRLRERIGREANAPASVIQKMEAEVRPLREAALLSAPQGAKAHAFREALIKSGEGYCTNIESKVRRKRKGFI